MNKFFTFFVVLVLSIGLTGCYKHSQESKDARAVEQQQSAIAKAQPVPKFDYSLERQMLINLYKLRNQQVATHSVWRGDTSVVEGDCPSIAFSLPYDTSLTNPVAPKRFVTERGSGIFYEVVEQPEPNAIFASKNTSATWVMCAGEYGNLEPIYVEAKVTVYPYPVDVDYVTNRVIKAGEASATIKLN